jgi:hypothetical protein
MFKQKNNNRFFISGVFLLSLLVIQIQASNSASSTSVQAFNSASANGTGPLGQKVAILAGAFGLAVATNAIANKLVCNGQGLPTGISTENRDGHDFSKITFCGTSYGIKVPEEGSFLRRVANSSFFSEDYPLIFVVTNRLILGIAIYLINKRSAN